LSYNAQRKQIADITEQQTTVV